MVNYVYQPSTMGDMLAIYFEQTLPATHHLKKDNVVFIYHQQKLIGVNVFQPKILIKDLEQGIIRRMKPSLIEVLNQKFIELNVDLVLPPFHSQFVVGEVQQVELHPDADALFVCQVNIGTNVIQIVTNSQKVKPSHRLVIALPGAMLLDGQVLQEGMMLKVLSQGMFCSEKTLGINPETQVGVYLLGNQIPIGKDYYGS
jgi:tRNA-binding EMAP/Myf-like protein